MILERRKRRGRRREAAATRAAHKRAVELERARRPIVVVAEDTSLAELARTAQGVKKTSISQDQ